MNIEFEIPDEKVQNLSKNAKDELKTICKKYSEEILDEASRIEASRRNPETDSEITATIIKEADIFKKRFPTKIKKTWWLKIIQLIAFISSIVTGSLLDTDKFKETSHVIWFIIALFVAISTTVFITFNKEQNG
jgi:hypothetical protein